MRTINRNKYDARHHNQLALKTFAREMYDASRGAPRPLTMQWCLVHAKNLFAARERVRRELPVGTVVTVALGRGPKKFPDMYEDENGAIGIVANVSLGQWNDTASVTVRIIKRGNKPTRDSRVQVGRMVVYSYVPGNRKLSQLVIREEVTP